MLSIVFGLVAIGLGLWGVWTWNGELMHFLKGMLPISLLFAGIIAVVAGFSSLSSKRPSSGSKKGS